MRKATNTAGPTPGLSASPCATSPAREKIPTPMMPPTPIAVSCHSPRLLARAPAPLSFSISSIWSTGMRRNTDCRVGVLISPLPRLRAQKPVGPRQVPGEVVRELPEAAGEARGPVAGDRRCGFDDGTIAVGVARGPDDRRLHELLRTS